MELGALEVQAKLAELRESIPQPVCIDEGKKIVDAKMLAFDLETTGPKPEEDLIVQFGAVRIEAGKVKGEPIDQLINPGCRIPRDAAEVHGVTDEQVEDAPAWFEYAEEGAELFRGVDAVVGYNALRFDIPMVEREFRTAGVDLVMPPVIDPFVFISWGFRHFPNKLEQVCDGLWIELKEAHNAVADIVATAELLSHMVEKGFMPQTVEGVLSVQGTIFEYITRERELLGSWLYFDRVNKTLHMGNGKQRGVLFEKADTGYMGWALGKARDLPPVVRACFQLRRQGKW